MPIIHVTDPDFCVCEVTFEALLEMQVEAESKGWATRWSSVDALRSQVKEQDVLLQSLMREERAGDLRAYRCLVMFSSAETEGGGGIATIDVDPNRFASLGRLDLNPEAQRVLSGVLSLAMGGLSMVAKR